MVIRLRISEPPTIVRDGLCAFLGVRQFGCVKLAVSNGSHFLHRLTISTKYYFDVRHLVLSYGWFPPASSLKEKAANKIDGDTDSIDMVFLEHLRHKFKSDTK